jgi:taurine dioxygenase
MTALASTTTNLPFTPSPLSDVLGAEVGGFDVRDLRPGPAVGAVIEALRDHQVLVFRHQSLTPQELVTFTGLFGPPIYHVLTQFLLPEQREIYVISNIEESGKKLGNAYEGLNWHTDLLGRGTKTAFTVLYGLEVPRAGVDTKFASMYKAYEALPEARKRALAELTAVYSYEVQFNNRLAKLNAMGVAHDYTPLTPEQLIVARERHPAPIVDTNPYNGRKWLHPQASGCAGVSGMSDEDGIELVGEIVDYATSPQFRYDHPWRLHDLVMWDNRGLFHSAGEYDRATDRRLVHRCSIADAQPV